MNNGAYLRSGGEKGLQEDEEETHKGGATVVALQRNRGPALAYPETKVEHSGNSGGVIPLPE